MDDKYLAIYSQYLPDLKRAGADEYQATCPFHNDHNPSLFVNVTTGQYHCFGCGAEGDVFTFLQNYLGISFPEACQIASKYGIEPLQKPKEAWRPKKEQKPTAEEIKKIIEEVEGPPLPKGFTAEEIANMQFEEPQWIVENLIPQGTTLLAGSPKVGKSYLALAISVAVATGGKVFGSFNVVSSGPVVYLALEDTLRRIQRRLDQITEEIPKNLYVYLELDREKKIPILDKIIKLHKPVLLIVDTFTILRTQPRRGANLYDEDYQAIREFKKLADDTGTSILLIHHFNKSKHDDILYQVSGSTGITGAVDTILIVERRHGDRNAYIHTTGRDIEERQYQATFDPEAGTWIIEGNVGEVGKTRERQEIQRVLKEAENPLTPTEIAQRLGKDLNSVKRLLFKMLDAGEVIRVERGQYKYPKTVF